MKCLTPSMRKRLTQHPPAFWEAEKTNNARAILRDCRIHGQRIWARFSGKKKGTLWYYRALVEAFRQAGSDGNRERDELVANWTEW